MKISYGITVHNEAEELLELLHVLNKNIDKEDEIVVCVDGDDEKVEAVLGEYLSYGNNAIVYKRKLDGNFADHKNSVIERCSGDYIFHIDADEYPNAILLQQLKEILSINEVDLLWIPRVNTVDGMTDEDVRRWGWRLTENNWVNYPDHQIVPGHSSSQHQDTHNYHVLMSLACHCYTLGNDDFLIVDVFQKSD